MALKPINLRLWDLVVRRAKVQFRIYPSPAASHWVHKTYVEEGGRFLDSEDPRYEKIMRKQRDMERRGNHAHGIKDEDDEKHRFSDERAARNRRGPHGKGEKGRKHRGKDDD